MMIDANVIQSKTIGSSSKLNQHHVPPSFKSSFLGMSSLSSVDNDDIWFNQCDNSACRLLTPCLLMFVNQ